MITDIGNFYLYRHIRIDKNVPFYIGMGSKCNRRKDGYCRAYGRADRTKYWKNITNISKYKVEILCESNNYEFILQKEIEFIKLYGRIDLGTGTLVNLTNGGDGGTGNAHGLSKERREIISKANKGRISPMKGRKQTQHCIDTLRKVHTGVPKSPEHRKKVGDAHRGKPLPERTYAWRYKKIDQFTINGEFIKSWNTIRDAGKYYKVGGSEISITCKANRGDYPLGHKSYNRKTCRGFIWKYNEN